MATALKTPLHIPIDLEPTEYSLDPMVEDKVKNYSDKVSGGGSSLMGVAGWTEYCKNIYYNQETF